MNPGCKTPSHCGDFRPFCHGKTRRRCMPDGPRRPWTSGELGGVGEIRRYWSEGKITKKQSGIFIYYFGVHSVFSVN